MASEKSDRVNPPEKLEGRVDQEGRLVFPSDSVSRFGLKPGARVFIEESAGGLRLHSPVTHLAKVYVEPTSACNLNCRTCIRNNWETPLGQMSRATFERILEGLRSFSFSPKIFFGGFGEPLTHPEIIEMVGQAKALGGPVELITNGTLLTREVSRKLIASGLDILWVSLDGATPESYGDIRLGATLPQVMENLAAFREERWLAGQGTHFASRTRPELGIVFVAMKRNIDDLPKLLQLTGVNRVVVTNVLPYTAEMSEESLCFESAKSKVLRSSLFSAHLQLPRIDLNKITRKALYWALRDAQSINWAGAYLDEGIGRCPFIEAGVTAINWEGNLSPCLSLLYGHMSFLDKRERYSRRGIDRHVIGNVNERDLHELWNDPDYVAFREKVQAFDFAVCASCRACELSETNREDCFGNQSPTCGGCLWAKGVLLCP